MIFSPAGLDGAFVVDLERHRDDRGAFARTFDHDAFAAMGLDPRVMQCSVSTNVAAGTLRGMHYQRPPHAEAKLVRCVRGRIWDVAVDLRPGSVTFGSWIGVDLSAENGRALFLPAGTAHGFLTAVPDAEVNYQISVGYEPDAAAGFRWDDPTVGIAWPAPPTIMSDRDRALPTFAVACQDFEEHT